MTHDMDPSQVTTMRCVYCKEVQPKQQCCRKCKRVLGIQYDAASSTFSSLGDEGAPFFRCEKCNMCVPGRLEQMTHCDKCCRCIPTAELQTHRCVRDEGNCSICLGELGDSTYGTVVLHCGHLLHRKCYYNLLGEGTRTCPVCKKYLPVGNLRRQLLQVQRQQYVRYFKTTHVRQFMCNDCSSAFPSYNIDIAYCRKCR